MKSSSYENIRVKDYTENNQDCVHNNDSTITNVTSKLYNEPEITIDRHHQRMEIILEKIDTSKIEVPEAENEFQSSEVSEKMLKSADNENVQDTKRGNYLYQKFTIFKILQRKEMILFYSAQILFLFGFYFPFIGIPGMANQYGNC